MHATFPTPFHPPWFDHPNNLLKRERGVQILTLVVIQILKTPDTSCYFRAGYLEILRGKMNISRP
jgi:hypothetical protein